MSPSQVANSIQTASSGQQHQKLRFIEVVCKSMRFAVCRRAFFQVQVHVQMELFLLLQPEAAARGCPLDHEIIVCTNNRFHLKSILRLTGQSIRQSVRLRRETKMSRFFCHCSWSTTELLREPHWLVKERETERKRERERDRKEKERLGREREQMSEEQFFQTLQFMNFAPQQGICCG